MAIAFVESNIASGSSAAPACSFAAAGTAAAGNLLVSTAFVAANTALTVPSGWSAGTSVATGTGTSQVAFRMAWTIAAGGETTATWASGSNAWDCWIAEYSGVDTTTPLDAQNATSTTAGTALTGPAATATAGERLVVCPFGVRVVSSISAEQIGGSATGVTERNDIGTAITLAVADRISTVSAGSINGTATAANSGIRVHGIAIFVAAAAAAAGPVLPPRRPHRGLVMC